MKATKKIIGAAAALVLSLGIATGSTYAWFASNSTATVDSFDVSVTSSTDNLLVAIGSNPADSAFKSRISKDDITKEIQNNIDSAESPTTTAKLDALTTLDNGVTFYNKAEAAKESTTSNSGTATAITTGKFVTFTLTFRSYTALSLMLDTDSKVESTTQDTSSNLVVAWADSSSTSTSAITADKYGTAVSLGSKIAARAANAARVSFVTGTSGSQTGKVWSPNEANVNGSQASANTDSRGKGSGRVTLQVITIHICQVTQPLHREHIQAQLHL
jgi:hypothetical protein